MKKADERETSSAFFNRVAETVAVAQL